MATTVTADPASGTAKLTAFNFAVDSAPSNDTSSFDATKYPTEPEVVYKIVLSASGQQDLVSNTFATNPGGTAEWSGVLIPAAGSWTATLTDTSDDSSVATASITVS